VAVEWARAAYELSERHACRLFEIFRSTVRYRSDRPSQDALRIRIRELAGVRVRSGYRQIHVLLRREGWQVNHKRVYRLYTDEGLTLKPRRPKRRKSAAARIQPKPPKRANERARYPDRGAKLITTFRLLNILIEHGFFQPKLKARGTIFGVKPADDGERDPNKGDRRNSGGNRSGSSGVSGTPGMDSSLPGIPMVWWTRGV
jgi:hypothetical protein